ncbi:MAG: hypothetical protein V7711_12745 [Pseudomonadales bacterium]
MTELGIALIIDKLQPKTASYLSIAARGGALVLPGRSMLLLQIAPASLIDKAADIAAKHIHCIPAVYILESRVGHLALSSESMSDLADAVATIADGLGCDLPRPAPAKIISSELTSRVDSQHAYSINKSKMGSMVVPGESIYVLACQHSSNALKAANEAEKAADIKIVDFRFTGSMGRLVICGKDQNVRAARDAALAAIE